MFQHRLLICWEKDQPGAAGGGHGVGRSCFVSGFFPGANVGLSADGDVTCCERDEMAKTYGAVFSIVLSLCFLVTLVGCGSGSEAVDTTGLSQITLRIEGMT